jgi:hypothetical protein
MAEDKQVRSLANAFAEESRKKLDNIYQVLQEEVILPSGGLLYPSKTESVIIKPITAKEEDILTNPNLVKSGKAFDMIVDKCVINWNGLTHKELLAGDKSAIHIAIRILSYTAMYNIKLQCPSCDQTSLVKFDLRNLKNKSFGVLPITDGENKFLFETPEGHEITFKLLTTGDINNIESIKNKNISEIEKLLMASIISLKASGVLITDRLELKTIIARMPHKEYTAFLNYIDKMKPDVDMTMKLECSSCFEEEEVKIPITAEFFWPAADRK